MHRDLKNMLSSAKGQSRYVVVANVDIRGFTSFFPDPNKAAVFLSGAYTNILTNYFSDISFFKPTGDGLLLVQEVVDGDEELLKMTISSFISTSLKLDAEFSQICASSIRMNWPKPKKIGIGIAWGDATRIYSESPDKTLDFSGRPLNLASRLMDLARPSGIVFGDEIKPNFLEPDVMLKFKCESVFIRGITDQSPLDVYITEDIEIPYGNRRPFGTERYREQQESCTLKELIDRGPRFNILMRYTPSNSGSVILHVTYPGTNRDGTRNLSVVRTRTVPPILVHQQVSNYLAQFNFVVLGEQLSIDGVLEDDQLHFTLMYDVPLGTTAAEREPTGQG